MKSFFSRRQDSQQRPTKPSSSSRDSYKFWAPPPRTSSEDDRPNLPVADSSEQLDPRSSIDRNVPRSSRRQLWSSSNDPPRGPPAVQVPQSHRGSDKALDPTSSYAYQSTPLATASTYPQASQRPLYPGREEAMVAGPSTNARPSYGRSVSRMASYTTNPTVDEQRGYATDYAPKPVEKSRIKPKESGFLRSRSRTVDEQQTANAAGEPTRQRDRNWLARFSRDKDKPRTSHTKDRVQVPEDEPPLVPPRDEAGDRVRRRGDHDRGLESDREQDVGESPESARARREQLAQAARDKEARDLERREERRRRKDMERRAAEDQIRRDEDQRRQEHEEKLRLADEERRRQEYAHEQERLRLIEEEKQRRLLERREVEEQARRDEERRRIAHEEELRRVEEENQRRIAQEQAEHERLRLSREQEKEDRRRRKEQEEEARRRAEIELEERRKMKEQQEEESRKRFQYEQEQEALRMLEEDRRRRELERQQLEQRLQKEVDEKAAAAHNRRLELEREQEQEKLRLSREQERDENRRKEQELLEKTRIESELKARREEQDRLDREYQREQRRKRKEMEQQELMDRRRKEVEESERRKFQEIDEENKRREYERKQRESERRKRDEYERRLRDIAEKRERLRRDAEIRRQRDLEEEERKQQLILEEERQRHEDQLRRAQEQFEEQQRVKRLEEEDRVKREILMEQEQQRVRRLEEEERVKREILMEQERQRVKRLEEEERAKRETLMEQERQRIRRLEEEERAKREILMEQERQKQIEAEIKQRQAEEFARAELARREAAEIARREAVELAKREEAQRRQRLAEELARAEKVRQDAIEARQRELEAQQRAREEADRRRQSEELARAREAAEAKQRELDAQRAHEEAARRQAEELTRAREALEARQRDIEAQQRARQEAEIKQRQGEESARAELAKRAAIELARKEMEETQQRARQDAEIKQRQAEEIARAEKIRQDAIEARQRELEAQQRAREEADRRRQSEELARAREAADARQRVQEAQQEAARHQAEELARARELEAQKREAERRLIADEQAKKDAAEARQREMKEKWERRQAKRETERSQMQAQHLREVSVPITQESTKSLATVEADPASFGHAGVDSGHSKYQDRIVPRQVQNEDQLPQIHPQESHPQPQHQATGSEDRPQSRRGEAFPPLNNGLHQQALVTQPRNLPQKRRLEPESDQEHPKRDGTRKQGDHGPKGHERQNDILKHEKDTDIRRRKRRDRQGDQDHSPSWRDRLEWEPAAQLHLESSSKPTNDLKPPRDHIMTDKAIPSTITEQRIPLAEVNLQKNVPMVPSQSNAPSHDVFAIPPSLTGIQIESHGWKREGQPKQSTGSPKNIDSALDGPDTQLTLKSTANSHLPQGTSDRPSSSHRTPLHASTRHDGIATSTPFSQPIRRLLNRPSQMNLPTGQATNTVDHDAKAGTRHFTFTSDQRTDKEISPRLGRTSLLEVTGDSRPDNSSRESLNPRARKRYSATMPSAPQGTSRSSPRHQPIAAPSEIETAPKHLQSTVKGSPGGHVVSLAEPVDHPAIPYIDAYHPRAQNHLETLTRPAALESGKLHAITNDPEVSTRVASIPFENHLSVASNHEMSPSQPGMSTSARATDHSRSSRPRSSLYLNPLGGGGSRDRVVSSLRNSLSHEGPDGTQPSSGAPPVNVSTLPERVHQSLLHGTVEEKALDTRPPAVFGTFDMQALANPEVHHALGSIRPAWGRQPAIDSGKLSQSNSTQIPGESVSGGRRDAVVPATSSTRNLETRTDQHSSNVKNISGQELGVPTSSLEDVTIPIGKSSRSRDQDPGRQIHSHALSPNENAAFFVNSQSLHLLGPERVPVAPLVSTKQSISQGLPTHPPPSTRPALAELPPMSAPRLIPSPSIDKPSQPPPSTRPALAELPPISAPRSFPAPPIDKQTHPPPSTRPALAELPPISAPRSFPATSVEKAFHFPPSTRPAVAELPAVSAPRLVPNPSVDKPSHPPSTRPALAELPAVSPLRLAPAPSTENAIEARSHKAAPLHQSHGQPTTAVPASTRVATIALPPPITLSENRSSTQAHQEHASGRNRVVSASSRPGLAEQPSRTQHIRQGPPSASKPPALDFRYPSNTADRPLRRPPSMRHDPTPVSAPPGIQQHPQVARKYSEHTQIETEAKVTHRSHDNNPLRHRHSSSMPVNNGMPVTVSHRQPPASGNRYALLQTIPGSTRQAPIPLPSQSFETIHQTGGGEADETILLTPSSLNAQVMLPSSSQQSLQRPSGPQRVVTSGPLSSSRNHSSRQGSGDPTRRSDHRRSRIVDDREAPPIPKSHGHPNPGTHEQHRSVPIHGVDHPRAFNPFKYLGGSRRKRTMSMASIEARDGASTVVGSPSTSICSTAPFALPAVQDPLEAAEEWRNQEEVKFQESTKNRRPRPGVVFGVPEGSDEEVKRRPRRVPRKKSSGRAPPPEEPAR